MYWIIQNNLWNERGFTDVVNCLDRMSIPYEIVKVIPFADEIADENNEVDENWSPPKGSLVYVCGDTTLVKIAKKKGWTPGAFINDNFNMKIHDQHWKEFMLNYNSVFTTFGKAHNFWDCVVDDKEEQFFIRPVKDDKTFAGHLITYEQLRIWQKKVIKLKDTYTSLDENTEILISPVEEIYKEYRFFIVDKEIATYSLYKLGDRVVARNDFIDEDLKQFVISRIEEYAPDRAFVIDIADTPNGYKIIEVNCINSSGFYACDINAMVEALENMKFNQLHGDK